MVASPGHLENRPPMTAQPPAGPLSQAAADLAVQPVTGRAALPRSAPYRYR
jgi:hypothetical protein